MPIDKFTKLARMSEVRGSTPLADVPKLDPNVMLGTAEERSAEIERYNAAWEVFFRASRQILPDV